MNAMNITEDYVSFEVAKLLKENGFDGECDLFYRTDESELIIHEASKIAYSQGIDDECVIIPTLQMAMKWLREVHNIIFSVEPHSHKGIKVTAYEFVYWHEGNYHIPYEEKYPKYHPLFGKTWDKYEEACEVAIKYCLENLI